MLQRKKVSILLETGAKGKGQVKQSCICQTRTWPFVSFMARGLP